MQLSPGVLELLACPSDKAALTPEDDTLTCKVCGASYPISAGVVNLLPMVTSDDSTARAAAHSQWTANPAGIVFADHHEGTPEFYSEMTRTRYALQPWHPQLLEDFAPAGALLEIGCGAGTDHAELARHASVTVGIDLTEHGAWLTQTRLSLELRVGAAVVADAEKLPIQDRSADAVYSFGVIHHTDHPDKVAAEMQRVMRRDAKFMVALYHRYSLFAAAKLVYYLLSRSWLRGVTWQGYLATLEYGATNSPPTVRLYSRRSARALFAGFRDVEVTTRHVTFRGKHLDAYRCARPFGWYLIVTGRM
jgi:ubiquinone/menaquinone biosynthesis C-methylase UbiE/uncharacterized protein YbaR (Trm112 family)